MITKDYDRGVCSTPAGTFKFTQDQIAQLNAIWLQQSQTPNENGAGVPIYQFILNCISYTVTNDLGASEIFARSDVDPAVFAWISGAVSVNSGVGFYADYIREYTRVQYQMRGGPKSSGSGLKSKPLTEGQKKGLRFATQSRYSG